MAIIVSNPVFLQIFPTTFFKEPTSLSTNFSLYLFSRSVKFYGVDVDININSIMKHIRNLYLFVGDS